MKPITLNLVVQAKDMFHQYSKLEEEIIDRINYVMMSIFELFGKTKAYWYFYGAGEGEVGPLWNHYSDEQVTVVADNCPGESMVVLLKDGSEWSLGDGFPTRWLFENFEDELRDGKKSYEDKQKQRLLDAKKKRLQQKEKYEALAQSAKSKLTKEELAALRRTL